MSGVQVLVHLREPEDERGAVVAAYREAHAGLEGTPGLLGDRLLRSMTDAGRLTLLMEFADRPSYERWESEHRRRGHPSPLRRYQDRDRPDGHHELFAVAENRCYTAPSGDGHDVSPSGDGHDVSPSEDGHDMSLSGDGYGMSPSGGGHEKALSGDPRDAVPGGGPP